MEIFPELDAQKLFVLVRKLVGLVFLCPLLGSGWIRIRLRTLRVVFHELSFPQSSPLHRSARVVASFAEWYVVKRLLSIWPTQRNAEICGALRIVDGTLEC